MFSIIKNRSVRTGRAMGRSMGCSALLAVLIPCAAISPRAGAQCNCTCDALVPTSQQINASMMNESGASPTHMVSAGSPSGQAREVRHGNLFSAGMTVTHVCIALQSPTGQPGEIANIQIYQPDPDPLAMNLPGALLYDQQFQISPGFNGHQIVQLTTPQAFTGNRWLVVAYPTARPAIGHQGTRPRTGGNSAVYVAGPPDPAAPGWTPHWDYYDDIGGPGGTAGYLGMAPIIRPLEIGASTSACPYDPACCASVCSIQPSCCTNWDSSCDVLAQQVCFPGGCVTCPAGGIAEGEPCNTDSNGGCDTNGVFSTINCDTTICGSVWRDSVSGSIDTDWYIIDVVDVDGSGMSFFTIDIESEVGLDVVLQNDFCPLDPPYFTYTGTAMQPCIPTTMFAAVPSPGRYRISVRPTGPVSVCPQESAYTLAVDVDDCAGAVAPVNDVCNISPMPLPPGLFVTFDNTGATQDGPPEPCGFTGLPGVDSDVWFLFVAPCGGTLTVELAPASANPDRLLSLYDGCPQWGGGLITCSSAVGGPPAVASAPVVAGQTILVRAGTFPGHQGLSNIIANFQSNCAGDHTGDCMVGIADLLLVIGSWGQPCPQCPGGIYGIGALLQVIGAWGACP